MSGMGPSVSRRGLLKSGLLALPALAGSRMLSALVASPDEAVAAAAAPGAAAPYDPGTHDWAFVCHADKCIGCGLCVEACKLENHVPLDPEFNRTWVERHTVTEDGTVLIDSPHAGIDGFPPESTAEGAEGKRPREAYFVPRLCMQCENPPCVSVCPVSATYKSDDGVVLVDADRCIGCGYCVVACPYGARYIVPSGEETPVGTAGVADKCTFCYQRITRGEQPACAEVCPVGARELGDRKDPASPINVALRDDRIRVLKPEQGTEPRVFYLGLEDEVG